MKLKIILLILVILCIGSSLLTGLFYFNSAREFAIREAHSNANLNIAVISEQVDSLLEERQKVLKSLAGLPEIKQAVSDSGPKRLNTLNRTLQYFQETMAMQDLYLMGADGTTIAASNYEKANSFIGKNYAFRSYFTRAMQGYPSSYFALGVTSNRRGIYLGQPVLDNQSQVTGVLVAKEYIFFIHNALANIQNGVAVLSSPEGVVFVSSKPEWLYQSLQPLSAEKQQEILQSREFGDQPITWLGLTSVADDRVINRQGQEFVVHDSELKNNPGWRVTFFHNSSQLQRAVKLPLFRSVGVTVGFLCLLVIGVACLLYLIARKDMRRQRQTEQRLKRAQEHFQKIFEFASDAIFILRENGDIIDANHNACEKLRFSKHELVKLNILAIEFKALPQESLDLSAKIGVEQTLPMEGMFRRKDGIAFPAEISMGLFHEEPPRLFVAIARDITERRAIEQERARLNKRLDEKNKEMEQVVYVTSHDLRSPLVSIEGFSGIMSNSVTELLEILDRQELPTSTREDIAPLVKDCQEAAKYINKGIASMASLLSGILQFSRLGRIELMREELDMNRLLSDLLDSFKSQIDARNATINLQELPPCHGDRANIHQLFSNLIGNALKYAHPDRPARITISGQQEANKTVYCVKDNGVGIAVEYAGKVFEMFHQLDAKAAGDGLGLSIVAKIVERHEGRVWVEPNPDGIGCSFYVSL